VSPTTILYSFIHSFILIETVPYYRYKVDVAIYLLENDANVADAVRILHGLDTRYGIHNIIQVHCLRVMIWAVGLCRVSITEPLVG
jgi:hypothetical protein